MRRHQAARKRMRGQMKNFKYLMQSLVQQVGGGSGGGLHDASAAHVCAAASLLHGL